MPKLARAMNSIPYKNQIQFLIYFSLSTLFTWWFVSLSPMYISIGQEILSTFIAGGKWGLQIILAFVFLRNQRWYFVKNIGFVCFLGSCILMPYVVLSYFGVVNDSLFFIGSLVASVVAMIYYYYKAVKLSQVNIKWWIFWLFCLGIAITLQLTIVFHVI